jgi:ABC-2 type transport system ATP-binding protein
VNGEKHSDQPVVSARNVWREFAGVDVLRDVTLEVPAGEVHALLGPNGAGKTTLLRILSGLTEPTRGAVTIAGAAPRPAQAGAPSSLGFVPSSDRSFYLRISGLENLVFFARLHGLRRRDALVRARVVLDQVGLGSAAGRRSYEYSHGMLKRLGVARALLTEPPALLVDEATHDLDPEGARAIRELTRRLAEGGTAVIWTTQRLEEIRALADRVSVLARGELRFCGTPAELEARAPGVGYVVNVTNGGVTGERLLALMRSAVNRQASVESVREAGEAHFRLTLAPDAVLGEVLAALARSKLVVLGCTEERRDIEDAFLSVTSDAPGGAS